MQRFPYRLCLAVALGMAAFLAPSPSEAEEATGKKVYQTGLRSTVWVLTDQGTGTGWVADRSERLIVTNHHVVGNAEKVDVVFPMYRDGKLIAEREEYRNQARAIVGHVIDSDPRRDLAVIQLDELPIGAAEMRLAAESASPGETVHSIGNPGKSDALWVYTKGEVRQVYRKETRFASGLMIKARVVETQAPLNPGDSGGPVINSSGELIGIVSSYRRDAQLISNCIDVAEVQSFLDRNRELLAEKRVWPTAPIVIRAASIERILPRWRSLGKLLMKPAEYQEMDNVLKEWIDSDKLDFIDKQRPSAAYFSTAMDDEVPSGVVLVPLKDQRKAIASLRLFGLLGDRGDDEIYPLDLKDAKVQTFVRFSNGYAYVAFQDRALIKGRNLADPSRFLPKQSSRLFSMGLRLQRLPETMLKEGRNGLKKAQNELSGKDPSNLNAIDRLEWRIRKTLLRWGEAFLNETDEIWLHADYDPGVDEVSFELTLTGRRGSALAQGIGEIGRTASIFHGITGPDPAARVVVCARLPDEIRLAAGAAMDEMFPQGNPGADLLRTKFDFLRTGNVDLFYELQGPDSRDNFLFIHGARQADGKKLEQAFRNVLAGAKDVRFDLEKLGNASVHRANFMQLDQDGTFRQLVGDNLTHFVISDRVHFEVTGSRSLETLRSIAGPSAQVGPQLLMECSVGRLAQHRINPDDKIRNAARRTFKPGVPDRVQMTMEGGRSLKVRAMANTSVLRFLVELGE